MYKLYKRFEKCFFKADKSQDMTNYIRLKYQFRAILMMLSFGFVPTIYMLIVHQFPNVTPAVLLGGFLIGYRTKCYNILRMSFFVMMVLAPARYPKTSMVLVTPTALIICNIQTLIQTNSVSLQVAHLGIHAIGFYFYGMDLMLAKLKEMSPEEVADSFRNAMIYTFMAISGNLLSVRLFNSQFSSLVRKINKLKDNISKVNTQLNEQNSKLKTNLEMKDVFIYTFSHELKNALNGLLGNVYLGVGTAKDPRVLQFLSSAKVCGEVLKNFIHNILDSGKLENGHLEVSPERKDVMSFMQNIWTICGRIIQNKRLKGSLEIEKNVPKYLDIDEQRMIQIILNLVSNACKFTEKGHVRIHVSWQTISAPGSQQEVEETQAANTSQARIDEANQEGRETTHHGDIREFPDTLEARPSKKESHHLGTEYQKKFISDSKFYQLSLMKPQWNQGEVLPSVLPEGSKGILKIQVLDSGCGMSLEDQAKLFKKFSQVSSTQDQRKVGTGLGLWICKELARRLDGDIITRSIVGVGSVFELTVRTKVPYSPEIPRNYRPSLETKTSSFMQRTPNMQRILVADDDSFNIELMKNYLTKFGISYICAYDGEEAVSLFKKHYKEICFIITDNFMPKKTGTEAALEIASFLEEKRQPKIPIMCISGDLKMSVGEKGITSVIQKPINFDRLKEELMAVYPQLTQITYEGDSR